MVAIWEKLIAWLWPARCVGCNVRGEYLCAACAATLARSTEAAPPGTLALYDYADPRIKRLIWRLKYRGHRALAGEGGRLLHDGLLETLAEAEEWQPALLGEPRLLLPAPLAAGRRRRRGYNQAAELARALARASPELWELQTGWLIKIRETPSQVSLRDRRGGPPPLPGAPPPPPPPRPPPRRGGGEGGGAANVVGPPPPIAQRDLTRRLADFN